MPEGASRFGFKGNAPQRSTFNQPKFNDDGVTGGTNGNSTVHNPLDRFTNAKPRDIRGQVSSGRRAGDVDTDGAWPLPNGYMGADGSVHTTTASDHQSSTQHYNPDGKYAGHSEEAWNAGQTHSTTQHFDSEGQHTSTVIVERLLNGVEQKIVYREGQTPEITRSDDPAPAKPAAAQSCDRNPTEGASLGGAAQPSVKQVIGLTNLDLLRQLAEGQSSGAHSGGYFVNGGARSATQINPVGANGTTTGPTRTIKIDILHPTVGGGDTLNGEGDRPD